MAVETLEKTSSKAAEKLASAAGGERTVKMRFAGVLKGNVKHVALPIPLIANSQKYEEVLTCTRHPGTRGPLTCDVPMKWAGMLLAVGGHWQLNESSTPDLERQIAAAKLLTAREVDEFVRINESVDA